MIRPRWQKAAADILGNPVRSLLVVASIAVGLFAVGIITALDAILREDLAAGYAAANPANGKIQASWFEQGMVDRAEHLKGVREAEGALMTTLRARGAGMSEWKTLELTARRDFGEQAINRVKVESGQWPPGKGEIALDRNKMAELQTGLGEELEIELASGKTRRLTVVAVIQDQIIGAFSIGGGFFVAAAQGYVDADTLASLGLPDHFNTLYLTVDEGGEDEKAIESVVTRVRDEMEKNDYTLYSASHRTTSNHPNYMYVDAISGVLYLLGLLVVFLSGFLITNTISALLAQQINQIGVMKTVGARRGQVMSIYMMVLLVFGALACGLSIPLSDSAANGLVRFLGGQINIALQGRRMIPLALGLQILIAALVPQAAGFFPILRGASLPVQVALNSSGMGVDEKVGGLARLKGLSTPAVISVRNVFRHKVRLALTLVTLSLGGAVFIATFNVRSSLDVYIQQVMSYFRADLNITMGETYRVERVSEVVMSTPGTAFIEPWLATGADLMDEDGEPLDHFSILAPPAGSELVEPIVIRGRWIEPGDENAIVLSEVFLSSHPEIEVGDTIHVEIGDKEREWVVVGFFQLAGKSGGMLGYTDYEYLASWLNLTGRSNSYRVEAAKTDLSEAEQLALGKRVEERLKGAGMDVNEISVGKALNSSTTKGLNLLTTFLLIMAGLTALVGSIGLTGTMSLNVMERTREIGVLRAVGAGDRLLFRMVVLEGTLIGLISWVIGAALSFPISMVMADTVNRAIFDAPSTFTWTPDGFYIWLGIVIALAIAASLLPARSATRLTIREVLAYE